MHGVLRRFAILCVLIGLIGHAFRIQAQSVAISPGYTNIGTEATVQYTATVTGLANTAVTWSVSGVPGGTALLGTITSTGLYKAPAQIPSEDTLIEALASDQKTLGAVYVNIEPAGPTILSISPDPIPAGNYTITLTGNTFQPGSTVSNNGNELPTTYVSSTRLIAGGYQSSTQSGVFQAINPGSLWGPPLSVPFISSVPVPVQVISPTSASVILAQTRQFTSPGATGWTPTAGTISATGLFKAPPTIPASTTVIVTATGPGGSASATVTLVPIPPQKILPTSASLDLGTTQQFTSTGASTWSATYGTVTSSGLYTAPLTQPAGGSATNHRDRRRRLSKRIGHGDQQ